MPSPFLDSLQQAAVASQVFGGVELVAGNLRCHAKESAAPAWFEVTMAGDGGENAASTVMVRMATPDRWLSESIESDLMHTGDPLEELVEEELVELGHDPRRDGAMPTIKHFRSEDRLYTFENPIPCTAALASGDIDGAVRIATHFLLAYEAAFRELGDMSSGDDDE